eukprot:TRINITY_DN1728_c1_g1_i3.p1 TRINITY_DN1728_c1_g1~~TRINITY_DN1728_c1_g1_i3.p1  ORF type:complete len:512 (+),score=142.96 TRINITY_DN1728_c1_g1_i3:101-1636(+)
MASFAKSAARKTTKLGIFGAGCYGGLRVFSLSVNDDLDDLSYGARGMFRFATKPEDRKKVVVLGSGWGSLSFVKKLDYDLYDVTVVSPRPFFFYTPLLCGSTTGIVSPGSIIEPIRDQAPGARYLHVTCTDVDLESRKVSCASADGSLELEYDHLVVAVGAQPNTFGIPGVDKHAMFLKEVEHGRALRQHFLGRIEQAEVALATNQISKAKDLLRVVVVGGGPTGVEFCGELNDFIVKDLSRQFPNLAPYFKVVLVEALPSLLTMFQKNVGSYVKEHFEGKGIEVRVQNMVKEAEEDKVHIKTKDGTIDTINYGTLVWVAGVGMRPFTRSLCQKIGAEKGQSDRRGLLVDQALRVRGTKLGEVFAVGDCAVSGKPPTAQVAAQQGKFLGRMFRHGVNDNITNEDAPAFHYHHQGTMAYIGDNEGAAELFPKGLLKLGTNSVTDHFVWRSLYGDVDHAQFLGLAGFAVWRSVYFNKMYSRRGCWSVGSDWTRTFLFGRPAASSAQGTAAHAA